MVIRKNSVENSVENVKKHTQIKVYNFFHSAKGTIWEFRF